MHLLYFYLNKNADRAGKATGHRLLLQDEQLDLIGSLGALLFELIEAVGEAQGGGGTADGQDFHFGTLLDEYLNEFLKNKWHTKNVKFNKL